MKICFAAILAAATPSGVPANTEFNSKLKFDVSRGFGARDEWVLNARCELPLIESRDQRTFTGGCSDVFR